MKRSVHGGKIESGSRRGGEASLLRGFVPLNERKLMRRQPAILGLAAVLVAFLVTPSSASVEPRGGKWKGKTAQGLPIEFVVKKKPKGWKVVSVEYKYKSTCTGTHGDSGPITTTGTATQVLPVLRADDGTVDGGNRYGQARNLWAWGHFGGGTREDGLTVTSDSRIRGKFLNRGKAEGKLSREFEEEVPGESHLLCRTGNVRWTAHR
jgi:hypothetical protein